MSSEHPSPTPSPVGDRRPSRIALLAALAWLAACGFAPGALVGIAVARRWAVHSGALTALLTVAVSLIAARRQTGETSAISFLRMSVLATPLALAACWIPDWVWMQAHRTRLVVVLTAVAAAAWAVRRAPGEGPPDRTVRTVLASGISGWFLVMTGLAWRRYLCYGDVKLGQDTAYFAQCLWTTWHGAFFKANVVNDLLYHPPITSHFGAHVSPILFLLLPLYRLAPSPMTLFVVRNLWLAAGGVCVYALARRRFDGTVSLAWVAAYLLLPAVFYQTIHTFYLLPLCATPLLLAWWAWLARRPGWFLGALFLALLVREDVAVTVFAFGVLSALQRRSTVWWAAPVMGGLAWFVVATQVIIPRFGPAAGSVVGGVFGPLGDSAAQVLWSLLTKPALVWSVVVDHGGGMYAVRMLRSAADLPLLTWGTLVGAPAALINVLAAGAGVGTVELGYHYAVLPMTMWLVAGMLAAAGLSDRLAPVCRWPHERVGWVLSVCAVAAAATGLCDVLSHETYDTCVECREREAMDRLVAAIPAEASVAAPEAMLPQLSNRWSLFMTCRLDDYDPPARPDYIIIDADFSRVQFYYGNEVVYRSLLQELRAGGTYELMVDVDGYELYRRRSIAGHE